MFLYEEYIKRHNLGLNLVRHIEKGYLFARDPMEILDITWIPPDRYAGQYMVKRLTPNKDAHLRHKLFSTSIGRMLEWDEYEDYLLKYVKDRQPVVGDLEKEICAWEMFVFAYDSWFADRGMVRDIFHTLDERLSIQERHKAITSISAFMTDKYPNVIDVWIQNMSSEYFPYYCNWISDLRI